MKASLGATAVIVFLVIFGLIAALGFVASRWRQALDLDHLDEWGLGGRQFGFWITWFLIGGDFYTAYTVIAVPALVYSVGAFGFFAVPYGIIVYPIVYVLMPPLWAAARRAGHITAGDIVFDQYRSRPLEIAVAITGVMATMPYIALQLIGVGVVIKALGLPGEISLVVAFAVLAAYTYSSGLRAPAMIAFVKDIMIYVVVIAVVIYVPLHLGGYGAIFAAAGKSLSTAKDAGVLLPADKVLPYATLALGSALAAFMYPHTLTGIFAANSEDTVKRNAVMLPVYTLLLALIAIMGYMAHAAGVSVPESSSNDVVPLLLEKAFPSWFVGFAFAAIGASALVPAAVMSIGSANLFARNFWRAYVDPMSTPHEEAKVAKYVSLLVKLGALLFTLFLPVKFAIDLQLLGGLWILQTFPAVVFGQFTSWFKGRALFLGWAVGFFGGTAVIYMDNFSPIHTIAYGYGVYVGVLALIANVCVAAAASAFMRQDDLMSLPI